VELPDGTWSCVPVGPPGKLEEAPLTVFAGSLAAVLSGFAVRPTTHRVSNPRPVRRGGGGGSNRRMSLSFVLKPDYAAPALADDAAVVAAAVETGSSADEGREDGRGDASAPFGHGDGPDVPSIGLVGRVGWQNHAMLTRGISRHEAVSTYKAWKVGAFRELREMVAAAAAAVQRNP